MIISNIRMAFASLGHAKLRSFLTTAGMIIGIGAVIFVLSVGEGVKNEISKQVTQLGTNIVNISPGQQFGEGGVDFAAFTSSTLSKKDLETVRDIDNVEAAIAIQLVTGQAMLGDKQTQAAFIAGTNSSYTDVVDQGVTSGRFFDESQNEAVIGTKVAEDLFGESDPVGQQVTIRKQAFEIVGVLEHFDSAINLQFSDFNNVVYIPLDTAISLNNGVVNFIEIDAKIANAESVNQAVETIKAEIRANHGGEEDFTVIKQEDALDVFDSIFNLVTQFIAAIASISLLVGGVGIMNIMLVSVTERTHEIGVRKAVGATNRHILSQFLIEAVVLSLIGGLLGVLFAYTLGLVVQATINITPVITLGAVGLATSVSIVVGVIFGITPAIKAARKNPINALRYE